MPYSTKKGFYGSQKKTTGTKRARPYSSSGTAAMGYQRTPYRRMLGPPAALYPRTPTNALALKCVDVSSTGSVQSTTAPAVMVVPRLGSAFFNRLSNRTRAVSLQLTGNIGLTRTNAAGVQEDFMRIVVYYDRQANGANPSQSDLLLDTDPTGAATTTTVRSGVNINNRDRFMILRDRKVLLPNIGVGGVSPADTTFVTDLNVSSGKGMNYQEFIKLKGLESLYNSTNGGTIGDISAGSFGILIFNSDASGSPAWNFTLTARFKFLD